MNAQLVFMVGGDDSIRRVAPLLDVMGKQGFHLGPVGAGHAMECINNLEGTTGVDITSDR